MGGMILTSTLSIRTRGEGESQADRIRELNSHLEQLENDFEDLHLMVFGFDPEDG